MKTRTYQPTVTKVEVTFTQTTKNGIEILPENRKDYTFEMVTNTPCPYPKNEAAYNRFSPMYNASMEKGDKWLRITATYETTVICER